MGAAQTLRQRAQSLKPRKPNVLSADTTLTTVRIVCVTTASGNIYTVLTIESEALSDGEDHF